MDADARRSIHTMPWPQRVVIALGNEHEGIAPEIRRICSEVLAIPGVGGMDSLNVSVAAGVVFAAATKDLVRS